MLAAVLSSYKPALWVKCRAVLYITDFFNTTSSVLKTKLAVLSLRASLGLPEVHTRQAGRCRKSVKRCSIA